MVQWALVWRRQVRRREAAAVLRQRRLLHPEEFELPHNVTRMWPVYVLVLPL